MAFEPTDAQIDMFLPMIKLYGEKFPALPEDTRNKMASDKAKAASGEIPSDPTISRFEEFFNTSAPSGRQNLAEYREMLRLYNEYMDELYGAHMDFTEAD